MQKRIHACDNDVEVHSVVIGKGDCAKEDPRVEGFREKIHKDFDGKVLCKEVIPDPPERGPNGYAYIPLKHDAVPKRQKPFRQFGEKNNAMKTIGQQWLDAKFIERPTEKNCEWLAQAFAVPKKSATFPWRGVVDMRGLNSQTRGCNYPLPKIEDILVSQGKNFIFSVLDLRQAFHQQPMHPDCRHLTSTYTPLGIFQWKVNVMGLKNASVQFQRMMDDVLKDVKDIADCYIDDIIVGTVIREGHDLFEDHDKDLRRVLAVLEEQKLVVDIGKCKLFVPEVEFCGHILGGGCRRPAPGKLMAIGKWEVPQTITELRSFLGFTNYYSCYVKDYSEKVAILQEKLKVPHEVGKKGSKVRITWTPEDQAAFDEIKRLLCTALELQRVNPDIGFVLRVDASDYAVGATLEQCIDKNRNPTKEDALKGRTVPVAFLSRKLADSQRNWVPREKETYAIIVALEKWKSWIGLQKVLVLTDHKALERWYYEELDPPSGPLGRRLRWHQTFSKFDIEVGHVPGKDNFSADCLSRWAYPASKAFRDISKHGSEKATEEMKKIIEEEKREEEEFGVVAGQPNAETGGEIFPPEVEVAPKVEVAPEIEVAPVGAGQNPDGSPPGFQFKDPSTVAKGKRARTGTKPSRKSPPTREVGPDEGTPEAEIKEEEEKSVAGSEPSESDVEILNDDESDEGSRGGEQVEAPLGSCFKHNWSEWYAQCDRWSEEWASMQDYDENFEWPIGIQIVDGRMFSFGKLCVPTPIQKEWVRVSHANLGHLGFERTWKMLQRLYVWGDDSKAKKFAKTVAKECETCQACVRPRSRLGPMVYAPIPPAIMANVAIDVFMMHPVQFEGKLYDCVILCVDRHSGWLIAVPEVMQGLTGAKAAKAMITQWSFFGIPTRITSDQGPQFANSWWKTMCAKLGIEHIYTQPYHHQANGRVERAGQEMREILRKFDADQHINWVSALPRALRLLHDTPGESGLSPYETVFGRERFCAHVPYLPPRECEDAQDFFKRMKEVDLLVAKTLNELHQKSADQKNAKRKQQKPLLLNTIVWYKRQEGTATKMDTRWVGPCEVIKREGEDSYVVRTGQNTQIKAHRTDLKEYWPDTCAEVSKPMFFHKRTVQFPPEQITQLQVKRIVEHKENQDGSYTFLTQKIGEDVAAAEYLYPQDFLDEAGRKFLEYCQEHGLEEKLGIFNPELRDE